MKLRIPTINNNKIQGTHILYHPYEKHIHEAKTHDAKTKNKGHADQKVNALCVNFEIRMRWKVIPGGINTAYERRKAFKVSKMQFEQ